MPKKILILDDDRGVLNSRALLCRNEGHEVVTAIDGFDALMRLKTEPLPDLIISDLIMPHMSGFEFLSVARRRFPQIRVLASSGAYSSGNVVPGGVIADRFHPKGTLNPAEFLRVVNELLSISPCSVEERRRLSAPVWIPHNGENAAGIPFVIVTCTECLRSFPVTWSPSSEPELRETECLHCPTIIKFVVDIPIGIHERSKQAPLRTTGRNQGQGASANAGPEIAHGSADPPRRYRPQ